jgi:hypothetical protein
MIALGIFFLVVLILAATLGVLVFQNNPKRTINQFYLIVSIFISLWLTANWYTLNSLDIKWAKLSIQAALAFALMIPLSCHLLRLSILHPQDRFGRIWYRSRFLCLTTLVWMCLCFTDVFIQDITTLSCHSGAGLWRRVLNLCRLLHAFTCGFGRLVFLRPEDAAGRKAYRDGIHCLGHDSGLAGRGCIWTDRSNRAGIFSDRPVYQRHQHHCLYMHHCLWNCHAAHHGGGIRSAARGSICAACPLS